MNVYKKKGLMQKKNGIMASEFIKLIITVLLCLIASVVCYFFQRETDIYRMVVLLPIAYCFLFVLLLYPTAIRSKSFTVIIFIICCFLRYVLHPVLLSLYPIYGFSHFVNFDIKSIDAAILLMTYELVVCSCFLRLVCLKSKTTGTNGERELGFPNGNVAMIMFVLFSLVILLVAPEVLKRISFFVLKASTDKRVSFIETSTLLYVGEQIFQIGRLTLYILTVVFCKDKFNASNKKRYFIIALVVTILNLGVIIGEARSTQVQFAFAAIYLLSQLFPEKKKTIVKSISIAALSIILLMTLYKHLGVFLYDSYSSAIASTKRDMHAITLASEVYLLGPQTVASTMMLKYQGVNFGLKQLFFDFVRSFMGLNFIAKTIDMKTTTVIYNLFVTNGRATNGYLVPITAQGYLHFGWILSPIVICLFLRLSLYLEDILRRSDSAYTVFFVTYAFARTSTCIIFSNINTVITMGSKLLLSAGCLHLFQKFINLAKGGSRPVKTSDNLKNDKKSNKIRIKDRNIYRAGTN